MRRLVVLGGRGTFGRAAIRELEALGHVPVAAGRRPDSELQVDADDPDSLRGALRAGDVVLDAAGPFQDRSLTLLEAAVETGFDVVDINDSLAYAERVRSRRDIIAEAGIRVLDACSTVSAVSAAVLTLSAVESPVRFTSFLAPAARDTARSASARSLLRSVGRPLRTLRDGALQEQVGWRDRRDFEAPPPLGDLRGHLFESADSLLLPVSFPTLRTVEMYVDTNTPGLNLVLSLVARVRGARRWMERTLPLGLRIARALGSRRSGVGYEIESSEGAARRFAIVAPEGGYRVAVASAVLAVDAIVTGSFTERGLVPPHRQVPTDRLLSLLARWRLFLLAAGQGHDGWSVVRPAGPPYRA
jgi:Saccharopine dehydrogenase NADP binding domain